MTTQIYNRTSFIIESSILYSLVGLTFTKMRKRTPKLSLRSAAATLFLFVLLASSPVAAVDRSKFRTCEKTSFCRRHRHERSKPAFDYRLLPESIHFHRKDSIEGDSNVSVGGEGQGDNAGGSVGGTAENVPGESGKTEEKVGYYQKIKRMLSNSKNQDKDTENDAIDPYVRGPEPFFTATLANISPHSYYPKDGNDANVVNDNEQLDLAISFMKDGVARIRITEKYDNGDKPYQKARWTSDDLILNYEEMIAVDDQDIRVLDVSSDSNADLETIKALSKSAGSTFEKGNSVAFEYGALNGNSSGESASGSVQSALLLVQFRPFAIHMWRTSAGTSVETDQPIVSLNSDQLLHFEVRRTKEAEMKHENGNSDQVEVDPDQESAAGQKGGDADADADAKTDADVDSDAAVDKHGGKEIVGYWEDGLAIYADGTREERKDADATLNKPEGSTADANTDKGTSPTFSPTHEFRIDTDGMWEEKFGDHRDSKPYGPTSIGADIIFPASSHIFGLPEHASSTQLKATQGNDAHYEEPYRLYNLDVFEYELDETMALYGEVPLIVSQSKKAGSVGVFWFNPTETFVDVENLHEGAEAEGQSASGTKTHWISESGIVDLFLLPGPNPRSLYEQYARLTGRVSLPPMFSLGYHQCRWNYRDEDDVYQVHGKFEELDYPYDVLWLDIEHTDGKRYFTWDHNQFPNPTTMQEKLQSQGRKMVTIIDPHIKRDGNYYIHKEATEKGLYIKDNSGKKDYDGWCWPGSSSYLDFTNENVRSWWADQFAYNRYIGSTSSLYTWNDMNEPSVFNGPEVSMQKDLRNLDGIEHREWHNLYGILFQRATAEGLIKRNEGENVRPFVLSRSFFAGSQRYGAIWTGDNESSWSHLQIAVPMLLSLNIGALSFVGADVGGFFGNPDAELMTRWMQAGAYQPFFRGHAHHDAKRREPWIFGDEWMVRMRQAAMARYALLPYWYSVFREASVTGMPVMRTMWMEYPALEEFYHIDDQYLVGSDLLVKPVTAAGITETNVIFPSVDTWYDVDDMIKMPIDNGNKKNVVEVIVNSDIDKIPVYQRGGSIVPRKLRLRRSTEMMITDPYTLYIALDSSQKASGVIYMDDEDTFDHKSKGFFAETKLSVELGAKSIKSEIHGNEEWIRMQPPNSRMIERVVVMGVEKSPKEIRIKGESRTLDFNYNHEKKVLTVRKPNLSAINVWEILIL